VSPLSRLGIDLLPAVLVAVWYVVEGIAKLPPVPTGGRRAAVVVPLWLRVLRRVRGVAEIIGGLAVLGGAVAEVLGLRLSFPGLAIGLALAALAAWTAVEAVVERRWVRLALAIVGFALAVFYAGFRS